jgi:hypothetical protein
VTRIVPVKIGPPGREGSIEAAIRVSSSDPALAEAIARAVADAIPELPPARPPIRLRTRARASTLGPEALAGRFVVVPVSPANARHLAEIVALLRAKGPAGIQLVWDGASASLERHVFAVLEHARATPAAPPVVVAATPHVTVALRLLAAPGE